MMMRMGLGIGIVFATTLVLGAPQRIVEVDGPRVMLSEILEKGHPELDADVEIGAAPNPNLSRTISKQKIMAALEGSASTMRTILLRFIPNQVTITTRSRRMDCESWREDISQQISVKIPKGLTIDQIDCPEREIFAAAPLVLTADVLEKHISVGTIRVHVMVGQGDWPKRDFTIKAKLGGKAAPIQMAIRRGEEGTVVFSKANLRLMRRCRALADLRVGDEGQFQCASASEVIRARMVQEKTAIVEGY